MLGQGEVGKLFDRCGTDALAVEEVLSAYIARKFLKGQSPEMILLKLRYLKYYLQGSGRSHILEVGSQQFIILAHEVQNGGGRIGVCPTMTEPGRDAWNRLRKMKIKRAFQTHSHGGPGEILGVLTDRQRQDARDDFDRQPAVSQYFQNRYKFMAPPPAYEPQNHGVDTILPFYDISARSAPRSAAGRDVLSP